MPIHIRGVKKEDSGYKNRVIPV